MVWKAISEGRAIVENEFVFSGLTEFSLFDGSFKRIFVLPTIEHTSFDLWEIGLRVDFWVGIGFVRQSMKFQRFQEASLGSEKPAPGVP